MVGIRFGFARKGNHQIPWTLILGERTTIRIMSLQTIDDIGSMSDIMNIELGGIDDID